MAMDEKRRHALRDNQQKLRTELNVVNVLPALGRCLEDVEYSQVESAPGNVAKVDLLVTFLRTKEDKHFDGFCRVLESNGYGGLAKQLRADAGVLRVEAEPAAIGNQRIDMRVSIHALNCST